MKLRVHGTPNECRCAVEELARLFRVVSVSDLYPDRGASVLVRVYLEIRLEDPPGQARNTAGGPDSYGRPSRGGLKVPRNDTSAKP